LVQHGYTQPPREGHTFVALNSWQAAEHPGLLPEGYARSAENERFSCGPRPENANPKQRSSGTAQFGPALGRRISKWQRKLLVSLPVS
jgi:hypothetical protein